MSSRFRITSFIVPLSLSVFACSESSAPEGEGDNSRALGEESGEEQGASGDSMGGGSGQTKGGDGDGPDEIDEREADPYVPPPGSDLIPAFIAQGHLGRLVMSCDEGRTWVADQEENPDHGTCWSGDNEIECDHQPTSGRGLTYGDGAFFATFGWGAPSTIKCSENGVDWEVVLDGADDLGRFGGLGFLDGTLLAAGRSARLSSDLGETWSESFDTSLPGYNVRRAASAGDLFVIVGDSDEVVISRDRGITFLEPESLPAGCGAGIQTSGGIAHGNGLLVLLGGDGLACSSSDEGRTFLSTSVGGSVSSHLVFSQGEFWAYGPEGAFVSSDGENWETRSTTGMDRIGPIAVSAEGTFVGASGGWNQWYDEQKMYRSEDGVSWSELGVDAFTGGHPLRDLEFGYVSPSAHCSAE